MYVAYLTENKGAVHTHWMAWGNRY